MDVPAGTGRRRGALAAVIVVMAATCAIGASPASATLTRATAPRGQCLVPGTDRTLAQLWRPDMSAATRYVRGREGDISFAVRTAASFAAYRPDHRQWSASVLKAMLLVAYLDRPSVAGRPLTTADRSLLAAMITRSDNAAADDMDVIVGASGLTRLAERVGMTHFTAVEPVWGESEITPRDQTAFFLHIDTDIVARHRGFAMRLLASIVPSQRWGIGAVAPAGWKLYFKGGWGSGTGLIDNQVALLTRGCARIAIAVLTMDDGSHAYGKQTLKAVFHRLLAGLPTGAHSRYP